LADFLNRALSSASIVSTARARLRHTVCHSRHQRRYDRGRTRASPSRSRARNRVCLGDLLAV